MIWVALFALCAGGAAYSVMTGRVAVRWPVAAVRRKEHPAPFWFFVGVQCLGAVIAAQLAFSELG